MSFRRSRPTLLFVAAIAVTASLSHRLVFADDAGAPASSASAVPSASAPIASAQALSDVPVPIRARRGFPLRTCIDMVDRNYPRLAEARSKTDYYRAQLDEARYAPFSQWSLTAGVGLAPTVRGNSVYSPNTEVSLSSNLGLAYQANIQGFVPLWTFGKITNLIDAAEQQVKLGLHQEQKERLQVRLDVRKAYFGLQLARTSAKLLREAASKLDDAIGRMETQPDADDLDLLRLRTFRAELDGRLSETSKMEAITLAGLRFLTGAIGDFEIDADDLHAPKHQIGPVLRYLQAARLYRPDINMARVGIAARKAQVALAQSRFYPDAGLALYAGYSRAPEVADQLNPFVRDDANYLRYGFGLGMRWNLDFLPAAARLRQAEAQLEETRSIERYALGGVGAEVETAYAEVEDSTRREKAYGRAEGFAKQWMILVTQGIDLGTQEEKDLVDPARQYALQRFSHLSAMMDLNVAISKLALVTGWDEIAPDGR